MCNLNLPLVTWIDGELPEDEAAAVEQHVQACGDCRQRISSYETASGAFADYYFASTQPTPATGSSRRVPRWVPFVATAAAASIVIVLLLLPRAQKQAPPVPQVAEVAVAPVVDTPAKAAEPTQHSQPVAKRRVTPRHQPLHEDWATAQSPIQIAIPADSMFPPGAVPEGVAYIANVSFAADGSVQGFRLHP